MGAPPENRNAAKSSGETLDGRLDMRCRKADKAAWVQAARRADMKLGPWVVRALGRAVRAEEDER